MQIDKNVVDLIKRGAIGVMPTDTIFGMVASVFKPESLASIYKIKGRPESKQMVHLIGEISQLSEMGIRLDQPEIDQLYSIWPGPVSVILDCDDTLPASHCGSFTIAVRLPNNNDLRELLKKTGPIVATSVNKSGMPSLLTLKDIQKEFPEMDFYIDGQTGNIPSRLCRLEKSKPIRWIERS